MKTFITVYIMLYALIALRAEAQNTIWTKTDPAEVADLLKIRRIQPKQFSIYKLDVQALRDLLSRAIPESKANGRNFPTVISIPMPDGSFQRFKFVESSNMEEELQRKFPEIRAYLGLGIDDPYATIGFEFNPGFGFTAQILSKNRIFVDPLVLGNTLYYQSYDVGLYKKDVVMPPGMGCGDVPEKDANKSGGGDQGTTAAGKCRGNSLWKYRLAVACTHQYATKATGLVSPTKNDVLARINTTIGRVNQVYRKEFMIKLDLVAGMEKILFLTAASDKFTGNSVDTILIDESQVVITDSIGTPNFDIGHTFSTGAGGLANLRCVCRDNQKAKGVTGRADPKGDPYDIDYVSHEIGHQFGGDHTFNNNTNGSCRGNRSASSAFEPGSGTTIMAYAGICSPDNVQMNSDDYFHTHSYDQVINYIDTSGCKTMVPVANENPFITRMNHNGKTIPKETAFRLSGTAFDPDFDEVTYCWEQMDLGPPGTMNSGANSTTAPLFRSVKPTTDTVRVFPSLLNMLTLTQNGETLPKVAREMKFRLTVRDGLGGVATGGSGCDIAAPFKINVAPTGPFKVTQPNSAGITWKRNSCQKVKWNTAGSANPPVSCQKVNILLSTDGGFTYPIKLVEKTDNDGEESVTVPVVEAPFCRIMVEAADNMFFDINETNFAIQGEYNPELQADVTPASGCDKKDGKVKLTVLNPLPGATYKYSLDDGPIVSSSSFSNLAPGGHTGFAFLADTTCPIAKNFVVEKQFGEVSLGVTGSGTFTFCDGTKPPTVTLTATASGGSGQYSYSPANATRTFKSKVNNAEASFSVTDKITGCKASQSGKVSIVEIICSRDPNDITGPAGYGDAKMVSKFVDWPYKIRFENDPEFATAPAQIVKINMPVDNNLNLFSFRLGDFGFGQFNFTVPSNKTSYATRLDLTDSLGIVVDVTAGIDVAKREVFWVFESKDPATGLAPSDPFKGFLPVNDSLKGNGEGFVTFSIRPAAHTVTGDSVQAIANIVFDINEAILTPEIFNTIDALPPSSQVSPLAPIQDSTGFFVFFHGSDDTGGSGLASFDLFVSENNGPYQLNEQGITDVRARFFGLPGNTYRFFTLATDHTGNREEIKAQAEATTTIRRNIIRPQLGSDVTVTKCQGTAIDLTSFFELTELSQNWSTQTPLSQVSPGTFTLIATNTDGLSDTVSVKVTDLEKPDLGPDKILSKCVGVLTNLTDIIQTGSFPEVTWSTPHPDSAAPGNFYSVLVRNSSGCRDTVSIQILATPIPAVPEITLNSRNPFCAGDTLRLQSTISSGNLWSTGDTTVTIKVVTDALITLRTVLEGCTSAVSATVAAQVVNPGTVAFNPSVGSFTAPVLVSLGVAQGAVALYTLNGSEPIEGAAATFTYTGPFLISSSTTIRARARISGCLSPVVSKVFSITTVQERAATPVFSPPPGSFNQPMSVSITSATQGADIYYTTTGNTPVLGTVFTRLYSTPVALSDTTNVKAMAVKSGMTNSLIASGFFNITNPGVIKNPVISPGSGTYNGSVLVSISVSTPGATIYFTTTGNVPVIGTSFTRVYTGPFTLYGTTTIRAMAVKTGLTNSPVTVANLIVSSPSVVAPVVFSPGPGNFTLPVSVTLSTPTPDAQIFFTTNGVTPGNVVNTNCRLYTGPIQVSQSRQIKAIAFKTGFQNSVISVGNYSVGPVRLDVESDFSGLYFEQSETENLADELELGASPNPSSGWFNIAVSGNKGKGILVLRNVLGQTLMVAHLEEEEYFKELNLSGYAPGIYHLQFQDGNRTKEVKLIRE